MVGSGPIRSPYEHSGPKIELVEKLSDEDVHLEDVRDILSLNISKDVDEPLEVLVGRTDPQEVDLFASNARVSEKNIYIIKGEHFLLGFISLHQAQSFSRFDRLISLLRW